MQLLAVAVAAALHLSAPHIAVDLPAGWHGVVVGPQRVSGVLEQERARLANFPLPRKDDDVASAARRRHPITPRDVMVIVLGSGRFTKAMRPLRGALHITRRDIGGPVEGFPFTTHFVVRTFQVNGRGYSVWVIFGVARPQARLLAQANAVLATLRVG